MTEPEGVYVPGYLIPQVFELPSGAIRLPPNTQTISVSRLTPDEKARYYLEEASRSLALARYWAGECEV